MIRYGLCATLGLLVLAVLAPRAVPDGERILEIRAPSGAYRLPLPDAWVVARDRIVQSGDGFQLVPVEGVRLSGVLVKPAEGADVPTLVRAFLQMTIGRDVDTGALRDVEVGGHAAARTTARTTDDAGQAHVHEIVLIAAGEGRLLLVLSREDRDETATALPHFEALLRSAEIPAGTPRVAESEPPPATVVVGDVLSLVPPDGWTVAHDDSGVNLTNPAGPGRVRCVLDVPYTDETSDLAAIVQVYEGWLEFDGWAAEGNERRNVKVGGTDALRIDLALVRDDVERLVQHLLVLRPGGHRTLIACSRPAAAEGAALDAAFDRVLSSVRILEAGLPEGWTWATLEGDAARFGHPADWKKRDFGDVVMVTSKDDRAFALCEVGPAVEGVTPETVVPGRLKRLARLGIADVEEIERARHDAPDRLVLTATFRARQAGAQLRIRYRGIQARGRWLALLCGRYDSPEFEPWEGVFDAIERTLEVVTTHATRPEEHPEAALPAGMERVRLKEADLDLIVPSGWTRRDPAPGLVGWVESPFASVVVGWSAKSGDSLERWMDQTMEAQAYVVTGFAEQGERKTRIAGREATEVSATTTVSGIPCRGTYTFFSTTRHDVYVALWCPETLYASNYESRFEAILANLRAP